jgi:GT2 family glycosyltransferase
MTAPAAEAAASPGTSTPAVLALVVAAGGTAPWLRDCLLSLANQSYPRLGVLAVDDAAGDEASELLLQALGPRRVLRNERPIGFARSIAEALARPVAKGADFVLVVDPRASLDGDAVTRLVEAAVGIGVEQVGIVGAKIVDRDRPRLLRDIGRSSDRFGHPYSPLQPGEIDQGQFDRVLEVLSVSSSAMLISREAWERTGMFDERLGPSQGDLDLCWRARLGGYRVLMTPLARVRLDERSTHARAEDEGERRRGPRYEEDRAAIAAMLKNYGWFTMLWVVPLALVLGAVRLGYLTLGRRFEEALDVAAAWGWNLAHLPGTIARRRRAQKIRRVPDRALRRFMESAGLRLPRWFATAERILEEQRAIDEADEGEPIRRRLRDRTASLVGSHPVIVASFLAALVGAAAVRELVGIDHLVGGALPAFPERAGDLFAELASAARSTPVGGSLAPSPALGALGALSVAAFGDPELAQKAVLMAGPPLAAILMYRAVVRLSARPGPAVLAAAAYGLCALTLWAFSDGRIGPLIALAALPAAIERIETAFARPEPVDERPRFVAGLAVTIAVGAAAFPGILLAFAVSLLIRVVAGPDRRKGVLLTAAAGVGAAVLLFPFVPTLFADGGRALSSLVGTTEPGRVARLALGAAPGTWQVAAFLPISAGLALALVRTDLRAPAGRAAVAAVAGVVLSWLSAAHHLPAGLSNPAAYAALAAVSMATVIGLGLTSFMGSFRLEAFGFRQVAGAVLGVVLVGGIFLQSVASMVGTWRVGGPDRIPPAWAVVNGTASGSFRVLWMAGDGGAGLPPPAGDPQRRVEVGAATFRYALTDRPGSSVLDVGRPLAGPGPERLESALEAILGASTRHGGALLSSFGIRYIVAEERVLPAAAAEALDGQLDLDQVPAVGLTIYLNAAAIPPAAILELEDRDREVVASADPAVIARWRPPRAIPLERVPGGWDGPSREGVVLLSVEHDPGWRLEGTEGESHLAFGWATSLPTGEGSVRVRHAGRLPAQIQLAILTVVWIAALWVTRKPVAR